jgi:hypothetical protein
MYSNKPYFTADAGDGSGVAAAEAPEASTQTETTTSTEETKGENGEVVSEVPDEDDYSFATEESGSSEPASGGTSPSSGGEPPKAEVVSKAEYDKVVAELSSLKIEFANVKSLLEQPIVKSGIEYLTAKGSGANIDPAEFYEQTFGLDANKLSAEDLIRLEVKAEAEQLGVKFSEEEMEQEYESRIAIYEDLTPLQKTAKQKQLREQHANARKERMKALVDEKIEAVNQATEYWNNQEKLITDEVESLFKQGKKDFGLKKEFTQKERDNVLAMVQNNFLKFDSNKNVNVKHVIEVADFAYDPQAYIRKVSERAVERYKAEELKKRTTGTSLNPNASSLPDPKQQNKQPVGEIKLKKISI